MNELAAHLKRRIAEEGPLSVADYMEEALAHPEHGYYMRDDPLGRGGDFITAPEISQMFGELLGLWCAVRWKALGQPAPVIVAELGPGRGTLMSDALRAAAAVEGFVEAASVHLVETSPALRRIQEKTLADYGPAWYARLEDVPPGPTLLLANEFFDALPVYQFEKTADGWRERLVDVDADGEAFRFVLAAEPVEEPPLAPSVVDAADGSIAEASPACWSVMEVLAERLGRHSGAALVVDYGHAESAAGDTVQAVKDHAYADVLADPGDADLTTHVDFAALAEVARKAGAVVHGPVEQGRFLAAMSIGARAETLIAGARPEQAEAVRSAYRRLTGAEEMGRLFKVLAVAGPGLGRPPGFG